MTKRKRRRQRWHQVQRNQQQQAMTPQQPRMARQQHIPSAGGANRRRAPPPVWAVGGRCQRIVVAAKAWRCAGRRLLAVAARSKQRQPQYRLAGAAGGAVPLLENGRGPRANRPPRHRPLQPRRLQPLMTRLAAALLPFPLLLLSLQAAAAAAGTASSCWRPLTPAFWRRSCWPTR